MNEEKLRSLGRRSLIVLLLVTAVLLLCRTEYYAGLRESIEGRRSQRLSAAAPAGTAVSERPAGTVQPMAAVVNTESGGHFGTIYGEEDVAAVFQRFSADLGEALGSAGTPAGIAEEQFVAALSDCSVFLRFYCPQPMELLAAWLGAEANGGLVGCSAELLCLSVAQGKALLYWRDADGNYFCSETAASSERLRSRIAEYNGNGARYAYEEPLLNGGDSCGVLLAGVRTARTVRCTVPQYSDNETDQLLHAVGMNSFISSSYTETDGTRVFVSGDSTLRLSTAGVLLYRNPTFPDDNGTMTLADAATAAWQAAERCAGACCGDGTLIFSGISFSESQNSYTVRFDYAVDGIPVHASSGSAVEIVLRSGRIIQARMRLFQFSAAEETVTLLPDLQAFAIAAAEHASAQLCYSAGGETMNCDWVKTDG